MDKLKYILSAVFGVAAAYFKQYWILYVLVAAAVLLDLATGMAAAVITGQGLSGRTARSGFLKKLVLLVSVGFGTFLDVFMPFCIQYAGVSVQKTLLFSTVISVYICITECISIAENIVRCTDRAVPKWILALLREAQSNLDEHKQ